jgi:glycosyltransferase involved in cell wall biosynthesis
MNVTSLVSVIIPAYNRGKFINRAINSVLFQTYSNLEVIVVDDGSSDDTIAKIRVLQKNDPRVKVFRHQHNRGAQAARNTGIRLAQANFIAFLDSDNEWLPYKLERQMPLFSSGEKDLGVVYSGFRWDYADGRKSINSLPRYRGDIYRDALRNWIADTSTLIVRKEILYKAGLCNEGIRAYQEWDLCIRLARFTKFEFISEPLSIYHCHDDPTISKQLFNSVKGYLDVVVSHRAEMATKIGITGLLMHFYAIIKMILKALFSDHQK